MFHNLVALSFSLFYVIRAPLTLQLNFNIAYEEEHSGQSSWSILNRKSVIKPFPKK